MKIAILGGTTFDHIVHLPHFPKPIPQTIHTAPFHEGPGSTGAGKALPLTKLGVPNKLYSVLGDDAYGAQIIGYLEANSVDFTYDVDPAGTERHFNIMDDCGGRISMFITQSSDDVPISTEKVKAMLDWCDVVVLNIISYCKQLIPLVVNSGKPVWTDLHDYDGSSAYHQPFIDAAQYIHLSSDNLPHYRPLMERLIEQGKELAICTHGKQGSSLLAKDGTWYEQKALLHYPLVDANGAGDSFFAAFLKSYLEGKGMQECLRYGAIGGATAVTSKDLVAHNLSAAYLEAEYNSIYGK